MTFRALLALALVALSPLAALSADADASKCPHASRLVVDVDDESSLPSRGFHARPLDPAHSGGLREFSVVYTDRALNHMSAPFIEVMNDLHDVLTDAYDAETVVLLPGSGTFAMEAAARQFARGRAALVIRNGYFSHRWSDIFDRTGVASEVIVLEATLEGDPARPHVRPPPVDDVVDAIRSRRPSAVFAPHVETSTGVILPDQYIAAIAAAAREVDAIFVLDAVASGTAWVSMRELGVDALITAPQKGWSSPACAGVVALGPRGARAVREGPPADTLAMNLLEWLKVMDAYRAGGFSYHATLPTDCLALFRDAARETRDAGLDAVKTAFESMGRGVRDAMEEQGLTVVAAPGFRAPGVAVAYVGDANVAARFKEAGYQIAAGVPFKLEKQPAASTFRVGLFGLDKLRDTEETVRIIAEGMKIALEGVER